MMFTPGHDNALILIADDDPASLNMLRRVLEADGYRVEAARDGSEVLERFDRVNPALVLLDGNMPLVSGYEACRQLSQLPQAHNIPIVIFTAHNDQQSIDRAFEAGAADYITKPIHFSVLTHRIRNLLRTSYALQALEQERNLLRTLIDHLPEAVFVKDVDSRFLINNRTQLEWLSADLETTLGKTDFDFYTPEFAGRFRADEQQIIASDTPQIAREELSFHRSSGEERWHETTKIPLHDTRGTIVGIVGISRDVTERKRAEEALHRAYDDLERRVNERTQEVARTNEALQAEIVRREQVESNLLRERNLLRTLIDTLPDNVYVKDMQSRYIIANRAVTLFMGAPDPASVIGKTDFDFYGPGLAAAYFESEQRLLLSGEPVVNQEEPSPDQEGQMRWILTTKMPVRDAEGIIYGLVGIGRDFTTRKKSEEALRRSEAAEREQRVLAESLRDTAAALTNTLDPEIVMRRILENVGRVVPHGAANIMLVEGMTARTIVSINYPPEVEAYLRMYRFDLAHLPNLNAMLTTHKSYLVGDTVTDPNWVDMGIKETAWIKSNIAVPILVQDEVIGFLNLDSAERGFFTPEHTERLSVFADQAAVAIKNAQLYEKMRVYAVELEERVAERTEELQRAKNYAEAILNSTTDGIIVTRADSTVQNVNPAFVRLFGYAEEQVKGLSILVFIEPDQIHGVSEALEAVAAGEPSQRLEVPVRRVDGTQFHADIALSTITGPDNAVRQIVCSVRDITPRRMMELGLRETLEKEKELGELKSRFITRASHEFRTPLAVILSSLDLLERHGASLPLEHRARTFSKIRSAVGQMAQMLEDVLSVARAQEGHLEFNPAPIQLIEFCEEIMEEIAITSGKKHTFSFLPTGDCSEVQMDQALLRHIITNLLSNAVKYSPEGSTVEFTVVCDEEQTIFRVRDHGVGIPEKDQKHMFEPFHRADNVAGIPGTGLGLTIAQKAVEQHGGTIVVESEVDHGTTFTVTIPTRESDPTTTPG